MKTYLGTSIGTETCLCAPCNNPLQQSSRAGAQLRVGVGVNEGDEEEGQRGCRRRATVRVEVYPRREVLHQQHLIQLVLGI